jgi:SAM-dependent methyltransferase
LDGHVTGVDVDGPLGEAAMTTLCEAGHHRTRFVAGNVLDVSLEAAAFDVVYARLVLIHADDPLAVLRRMWQLIAPGGALIVQDYDLRPVACEPPAWVLDEFHRVLCGAFATHGRPLDAGVRLPRWFREAGIGAPEGTSIDGILTTIGELRWQLKGAYRSVLPLALEDGLTTVAASDAWFAELAAMVPDHTILHPLLCSAFARKPRP